jgi:DNA adenine methylase
LQYLGGKTRIAKQIAEQIDRVRKPGQWVWEPFCGGLSVTVALSKAGPVWATDANPALIALHAAGRAGWLPPEVVTPAQYAAAKLLPDSDPMKAFCGFCCSFSAKWFGGFARAKATVRNYAAEGRAGLIRKWPAVTALACVDFLSVAPRPTDALIYCDPPYFNTTGYGGVKPFDSAAFCQRVALWSQFTDVFVSEYWLPIGQVVWQKNQVSTSNAGQSGKGKVATERLYYIARGSLGTL